MDWTSTRKGKKVTNFTLVVVSRQTEALDAGVPLASRSQPLASDGELGLMPIVVLFPLWRTVQSNQIIEYV